MWQPQSRISRQSVILLSTQIWTDITGADAEMSLMSLKLRKLSLVIFALSIEMNHIPSGTEGKNQELVRAIPLCGEYTGPQFEDKFRSVNQMDGISIADGGKMSDSWFVNKRTCKIQCYICREKCIQRLPLFLSNFGEWKKTLISPSIERVIFVSLTVLEIFALIVDLSLT